MRAILATLFLCLSLSTAHARTALTANTTFYVNGDAVNSQTCGLTGGVTCGPGSDSYTAVQAENNTTPFLTLQAAINAVLTQIDWNGFRPTINLAHGSSTNYGGAECTFPQGTSGALWIQGDDTDLSAVTITALNSSYALYTTHYCIVRLRSVTVADQGSSVWGLEADNFGGIDVQNVAISAFNAPMIRIGQTGHLELVTPLMPATDSLFVNGSAPVWLRVDTGGNANFGESNGNGFAIKFTVHIAAGLTFSTAFIDVPSGATLFNLTSGTFTGNSFTGTRAIFTGDGFMEAGGAACNTVFPGSLPCQIGPFFQDDAGDAITQPVLFGGAVTTDSLGIVGGTLAAGANALNITATQPASPIATQSAVNITVTGNGSAAQNNLGFVVTYAAGYTGPNRTAAGNFSNSNAGTAGSLPAAGSNTANSNAGLVLASNGTTSGWNIGSVANAANGNVNFGFVGIAQIAKNSATNVGLAGYAINTGTSPTQIGVLASLNPAVIPSSSAALIADNGSQSSPVALFQVAGVTDVFIGATGGVVAGGANADEGAGTVNATKYYVAGTAGATCSGTPTMSFSVVGGIVTHC